MNNRNFYGLPLIALGMSMGQVAVVVEQKPEGFFGILGLIEAIKA